MAAEAFAARAVAGVRAPPGLPEVLADSSLATPLLVVIEAYLEVHGGRRRPRTRSDLLEELLRHEDDYWKGGRGRRAGGPVLRRRVVALATLAGASSDGKAAERLRRVPDLTDASEERRRALARWADELYGGPLAFWNPVKPDLLAEHLVATTYHEPRGP